MTNFLPPFQVDYDYLTAVNTDTPHQRQLSTTTLHMCLAALDAMMFNRYWQASGRFLTADQVLDKNDLVDKAVYELLEAINVSDDLIDQFGPVYPASGVFCADCEDDCEDDMPQIIKIGGVAYLTNNCGCGDTELYRLTPALVTIGEDGNPVVQSPVNSTVNDGVDVSFSIADTYHDCFAAKAVPYLLQRAVDYNAALSEITADGLDLIDPGIAEFLDLIGIADDVLDTDAGLYDFVRGYTDADVEAALTDSTYQDLMIDHWIWDEAINRANLYTWVESSPEYWQEVPVRFLLWSWVTRSIIYGYNRALKTYATECKTGNTLDDINDMYSQSGTPIEMGGTNYLAWYWTPGEQMANPENEYYYPFDVISGVTNTNVVGLFAKLRVTPQPGGPAGDPRMQIQIANSGLDASIPAGTTVRWGTYKDANAYTIAASYLGAIDFYENDSIGVIDPLVRVVGDYLNWVYIDEIVMVAVDA